MRNPKTGETLPSPQYGEPEHLYLCREERERGSAPSDLDGKNRRHNGPEQDTKTIQTHLYNYDTTGVLRTIRNNAGVRWTLTWDSGVNFVQHIDGPLGRHTTFAYNGSNNIRHIQDPSGRLTTLTINGNNDLVRIVTPELCTTSLVYDDAHHLTAWIDPLGNRNTYSYRKAFSTRSAIGRRMLIAAPAQIQWVT